MRFVAYRAKSVVAVEVLVGQRQFVFTNIAAKVALPPLVTLFDAGGFLFFHQNCVGVRCQRGFVVVRFRFSASRAGFHPIAVFRTGGRHEDVILEIVSDGRSFFQKFPKFSAYGTNCVGVAPRRAGGLHGFNDVETVENVFACFFGNKLKVKPVHRNGINLVFAVSCVLRKVE